MRLHLVIGSLERSQAGADGTAIQKYHRPFSGRWRPPQVPHGRVGHGRDLNATQFGRQAWMPAFPLIFLSLSYFTPIPIYCPSSLPPQIILSSTKCFHFPKPQCPHLENGNNRIMLLRGLNVLVHTVAAHSECLIIVSYFFKNIFY